MQICKIFIIFVSEMNEGSAQDSSSLLKDCCAERRKTAALKDKRQLIMQTSEQDIRARIEEFLRGTGYELITLAIHPDNSILVEVDRLEGTDVDFCGELNRALVDYLEAQGEPDYALEVGSVSLVDPFKTKLQYQKHLGHEVEVLAADGKKYRGQLVSVDEDTFSVDSEEKVAVEGKKRKQTQVITRTWAYGEPKYVKYDLKL